MVSKNETMSNREIRGGSCRERKRYLSGKEVFFECGLVAFHGSFGILKYTIPQEARVGSLMLPEGTMTYAFYWEDRPYNLYWWMASNGSTETAGSGAVATLGHYFNIADSTRLSKTEFSWRDLSVDILVLPENRIEVLDEDELDPGLGSDLLRYIREAKQNVLDNYEVIIREAYRIL